MKNDIVPQKLPRPEVQMPRKLPAPVLPPNQELPAVKPAVDGASEKSSRPAFRLTLKLVIACLVGFLLLMATICGVWYASALRPINSKDTSRQRISVQPGSSLMSISELLEQKQLIRSKLAFNIYARLTGAGAHLQAGTYNLSPSESAIRIISHFTSGNVEQFSITFLPGATLRHLPGETSDKSVDIESTLQKAGYGQEEIEAAFEKTYDHPLLKDKPASASLEGYVYGETYKFSGSTTVEQILTETFDEYYKVIEKDNLIAGFKAQGLTLHQGIILASIVQREVVSAADQKQVAQVFLTRLKKDMPLGSDVTYQYAAKKTGVPPTPTLNSPYNTRIVTGLTPGPISMPGESALQAVATPAAGDYLFFLSGDDNVTYFAHTAEEHQANIVNHCRKKCV